MFELWLIICVNGACMESPIPRQFDTETQCMASGNVEMHKAARSMMAEGLVAKVGWQCRPPQNEREA